MPVPVYRPKPPWLTFPNGAAFAVAVALTGNLVAVPLGLVISAGAVGAVALAAVAGWWRLRRGMAMAFALGTALEVLVIALAPGEVAFLVGLGALVVLGAASGHYLSRAIVGRRQRHRRGKK